MGEANGVAMEPDETTVDEPESTTVDESPEAAPDEATVAEESPTSDEATVAEAAPVAAEASVDAPSSEDEGLDEESTVADAGAAETPDDAESPTADAVEVDSEAGADSAIDLEGMAETDDVVAEVEAPDDETEGRRSALAAALDVESDLEDAPVIDLSRYLEAVEATETVRVVGRVTEVTGLVIQATVPGVRIGEMCYIEVGGGAPQIVCEVVGFRDETVMLMPLGEAKGVGPESAVIPTGRPLSILCGYGLLGRVLDGIGNPLDDGPPLEKVSDLKPWAVERECPDPMKRKRITEHIAMGVRAIDGLLTVGLGQRIGLFAGSGVGKSTLMGQIARNCEAEVVIVCLIGERGREVLDFIEESLGEEGLAKSVVIVATSNSPSLVRLKSAFVSTAIAEWFRDQGKKVLFMMDSSTRFARAQREIGLAIGEPPARQGYPPSVFAQIPRLMERTGNNETGSITALYTILVQGGDMEEPIADEVRGILDGHIILNRALGARNHWPAIDVLPSLSRVMNGIVAEEHRAAAGKLREVLATYEKQRDLILLGAYQYGTDPKTDYAIDKIEEVEAFLRQRTEDCDDFETTIKRMVELFGDAPQE